MSLTPADFSINTDQYIIASLRQYLYSSVYTNLNCSSSTVCNSSINSKQFMNSYTNFVDNYFILLMMTPDICRQCWYNSPFIVNQTWFLNITNNAYTQILLKQCLLDKNIIKAFMFFGFSDIVADTLTNFDIALNTLNNLSIFTKEEFVNYLNFVINKFTLNYNDGHANQFINFFLSNYDNTTLIYKIISFIMYCNKAYEYTQLNKTLCEYSYNLEFTVGDINNELLTENVYILNQPNLTMIHRLLTLYNNAAVITSDNPLFSLQNTIIQIMVYGIEVYSDLQQIFYYIQQSKCYCIKEYMSVAYFKECVQLYKIFSSNKKSQNQQGVTRQINLSQQEETFTANISRTTLSYPITVVLLNDIMYIRSHYFNNSIQEVLTSYFNNNLQYTFIYSLYDNIIINKNNVILKLSNYTVLSYAPIDGSNNHANISDNFKYINYNTIQNQHTIPINMKNETVNYYIFIIPKTIKIIVYFNHDIINDINICSQLINNKTITILDTLPCSLEVRAAMPLSYITFTINLLSTEDIILYICPSRAYNISKKLTLINPISNVDIIDLNVNITSLISSLKGVNEAGISFTII